MTLRIKILLIIAATFILLIGALFLASQKIILGSYLALEKAHGREDVMEACGFFESELTQMDMTVHDYATWDDTYAFIAAPAENHQYLKSNMIDETFKNQRLNLFLFMDASGRIVYAKAYDYLAKAELPVPEGIRSHLGPGSPLRLGAAPDSSLTGILLLPEGPMFVAARHILTSEGKGPARGILVTGRYYRPVKVQRSHGTSVEELSTYRADDPGVPSDIRDAASLLTVGSPILVRPSGPDTLCGYTARPDIYGKPAIYVRLRMPRDIYREGKESIAWFILALVVVGVAVGAMIAVLLQRQVLSRLMRFSAAFAAIGKSGDLTGRVRVEGADELAAFAKEINGMLGALEKSQAELWESEVRYRTIVENTRDVIMLTRPDGTISYMSPSCRDLLGYSPDELVNCRPEVWHPDDGERVKRAFGEAIKGGAGSTIEYRVITRDGDVKWISHAWSPVHSGSGFRMVVSVMRDITQRRRMEEELIKAQKLETVGVLAGGIAHDFNNILTAVWGYLSLAKAAAAPMPRVVELLTEAEKASGRARDLTQQLLTFSKGGTPVRKPLALGAVIKEAAGFALSGSNARCELDIPEKLWLADADEGQVNQAINNLVLNAIQAMPQGGVIRISARNMEAGTVKGAPLPRRNYIMISVRDEGIGIPEQHLQKIFDPYFTTKQQGSGLGLSITYSIVKNHEGAITVKSTLGKGATFCVYLPAAVRPVAPREHRAERPPAGTGRILLMDDDEAVRSVAGRMLRHIGYEVEYAGDGEEMLAAYAKAREEKKPFDAVLMDLTVSGRMGGKEAIGKLLAIDPGAVAIASSGYSSDSVGANLAQYGFKGFIPKPYRVGDLAAEIARILTDARTNGGAA